MAAHAESIERHLFDTAQRGGPGGLAAALTKVLEASRP